MNINPHYGNTDSNNNNSQGYYPNSTPLDKNMSAQMDYNPNSAPQANSASTTTTSSAMPIFTFNPAMITVSSSQTVAETAIPGTTHQNMSTPLLAPNPLAPNDYLAQLFDDHHNANAQGQGLHPGMNLAQVDWTTVPPAAQAFTVQVQSNERVDQSQGFVLNAYPSSVLSLEQQQELSHLFENASLVLDGGQGGAVNHGHDLGLGRQQPILASQNGLSQPQQQFHQTINYNLVQSVPSSSPPTFESLPEIDVASLSLRTLNSMCNLLQQQQQQQHHHQQQDFNQVQLGQMVGQFQGQAQFYTQGDVPSSSAVNVSANQGAYTSWTTQPNAGLMVPASSPSSTEDDASSYHSSAGPVTPLPTLVPESYLKAGNAGDDIHQQLVAAAMDLKNIQQQQQQQNGHQWVAQGASYQGSPCHDSTNDVSTCSTPYYGSHQHHHNQTVAPQAFDGQSLDFSSQPSVQGSSHVQSVHLQVPADSQSGASTQQQNQSYLSSIGGRQQLFNNNSKSNNVVAANKQQSAMLPQPFTPERQLYHPFALDPKEGFCSKAPWPTGLVACASGALETIALDSFQYSMDQLQNRVGISLSNITQDGILPAVCPSAVVDRPTTVLSSAVSVKTEKNENVKLDLAITGCRQRSERDETRTMFDGSINSEGESVFEGDNVKFDDDDEDYLSSSSTGTGTGTGDHHHHAGRTASKTTPNPPVGKVLHCQLPHCLRTFPTIGLLKSHMVSHNDEKPYWCDICSDDGIHPRPACPPPLPGMPISVPEVKRYKRHHDLLRHKREQHPPIEVKIQRHLDKQAAKEVRRLRGEESRREKLALKRRAANAGRRCATTTSVAAAAPVLGFAPTPIHMAMVSNMEVDDHQALNNNNAVATASNSIGTVINKGPKSPRKRSLADAEADQDADNLENDLDYHEDDEHCNAKAARTTRRRASAGFSFQTNQNQVHITTTAVVQPQANNNNNNNSAIPALPAHHHQQQQQFKREPEEGTQ
ncbi:hypothetical protein BGX23_007231 [Mortierella sp. AD031]|nr:hypothetical protein BGX23_007231 [Mortierella sp. AD031]